MAESRRPHGKNPVKNRIGPAVLTRFPIRPPDSEIQALNSCRHSADNVNVEDSKPILRDLLISLLVLALVFGALFAWACFPKNKPEYVTTFADPNVPAPKEPKPEPPAEPAEKEIVRYVVNSHTVLYGESFSLITGMYWDDVFLWPDLYVRNDMKSEDPDLIYPDEIVDIYNRLGRGDEYTPAETEMILDAYIRVYDRFKALGPQKDGSAWTLLWCGAKYNHDFLDLYAHRIDPADLAMARKYIEEEGYLD